MKIGTCWRPLWIATVCPTIPGKIVEARAHVRITRRSFVRFCASIFSRRLASMYGPFFDDRDTFLSLPFLAAAAHDRPVGPLVVAGASALGRLAPLRLGLPADRRLALTATVRMVARVHRRATDDRPPSHVPRPPGLPDLDVLVIHVPDLAQRRHALEVDQADLPRRHADLGVVARLGHQLRGGAGRAHHLAALAPRELDVVDLRAGRDVPQRQRIPDPDRRLGAGDDHVPDLDAERRQDVALLAVHVVEQRDPGRAVGIVFDRRHAGRNPELVALEINDPIEALGAAAAVPRRDAAAVVAAGVLLQRLEQALLRFLLRNLLEGADAHRAPPRRGWLVCANWHRSRSLRPSS